MTAGFGGVRRITRLAGLCTLAAVAGCGGGGRANAVPPTGSATTPAANAPTGSPLGSAIGTTATLRISVPKAGIATTGADRRTPKYISPASAQIRVVAADPLSLTSGLGGGTNAQVLGGQVYTLTPGANGCTAATGAYSISCVIALPVPATLFPSGVTSAKLDLEIETYAAGTTVSLMPTQVGGSVLSSGIISNASIAKNGTTTLNVVLGGVPTSALPSSQTQFNVFATDHTVAAKNTLTPINFYDAAGNVIVGPYAAPIIATVFSNTPDLQFARNGTPFGAGNSVTVSGSSDALDLAYDGKGMLIGNVQFQFGAPTGTVQYVVGVPNIPAYDQYDRFDSSGATGAQALFPSQNTAALTVDPSGQLWFVSNGGPSGKPVLANVSFSSSGTTVNYCNLSVPGPFSPVIVVDSTNSRNAYVFESAQGRASIVALDFPSGGACPMTTTTPISPMQPVVGAVLDSGYNVWTIDTGGQIGKIIPTGQATGAYTVLNPGTSDQISTSTAGGPLFQFNNGQTGGAANLSGSYGFIWADKTAMTLNIFDPNTLTYYREDPTASTYASQAGQNNFLGGNGNAGAAIFIDVFGRILLADIYGDLSVLTPQTMLRDTRGAGAGNVQALFRQSTQIFGAFGLSSPPTTFVSGAERNGTAGFGAIYGIVGSSQYPNTRGLVRYNGAGSAFTPFVPNTIDASGAYTPAAAVTGGDGRVWFLNTSATGGSLFAFPGTGSNSNTAQTKLRKAADVRH